MSKTKLFLRRREKMKRSLAMMLMLVMAVVVAEVVWKYMRVNLVIA